MWFIHSSVLLSRCMFFTCCFAVSQKTRRRLLNDLWSCHSYPAQLQTGLVDGGVHRLKHPHTHIHLKQLHHCTEKAKLRFFHFKYLIKFYYVCVYIYLGNRAWVVWLQADIPEGSAAVATVQEILVNPEERLKAERRKHVRKEKTVTWIEGKAESQGHNLVKAVGGACSQAGQVF